MATVKVQYPASVCHHINTCGRFAVVCEFVWMAKIMGCVTVGILETIYYIGIVVSPGFSIVFSFAGSESLKTYIPKENYIMHLLNRVNLIGWTAENPNIYWVGNNESIATFRLYTCDSLRYGQEKPNERPQCTSTYI